MASAPDSWTARAPRAPGSRSRAAVRPPSREPTTTRSPKPSAAMSSSMVRFIAVSRSGAVAASVGGGERLGVAQRERGAVHRERALAALGDEQLEPEVVVGVALAELGAGHLRRIGVPLRRGPATLG